VGRALVFITFPHRLGKHPAQIIELHKRLKAEAGAHNALTLRTVVLVGAGRGRQPRTRFFTLVDADNELAARAEVFAAAVQHPDLRHAFAQLFK
jgi:hypothetical protein